MTRFYKLTTPSGTVHKFVRIDGDDSAERQIDDYYFDGCEITLCGAWNSFRNKEIRDVDIEEIQERIDA